MRPCTSGALERERIAGCRRVRFGLACVERGFEKLLVETHTVAEDLQEPDAFGCDGDAERGARRCSTDREMDAGGAARDDVWLHFHVNANILDHFDYGEGRLRGGWRRGARVATHSLCRRYETENSI